MVVLVVAGGGVNGSWMSDCTAVGEKKCQSVFLRIPVCGFDSGRMDRPQANEFAVFHVLSHACSLPTSNTMGHTELHSCKQT